MSTWERSPEAGRPWVAATAAAERLGYRTYRTVVHEIKDGKLAGGKFPDKPRWYVYSDQPKLTGSMQTDVHTQEPDAGASAELIDALRSENLNLRVQIAAANETTQLVMAAQAATVEAAKQYRTSMTAALAAADGYRDAADGYRDAADHWRRAAEGFQSSADSLFEVNDHYRDAISQHSTPGHPG